MSCAVPGLDDDTTELFGLWGAGDRDAGDRLLARLYPELRAVARRHLRSSDLSLQPSDLLHEVWVRVFSQRQRRWQNRAHFFAIVARWVRRALADETDERRRQKRDPRRLVDRPSGYATTVGPRPIDHLALDHALTDLAGVDPIGARVVELLYYAGLSFDEAAAALELGRSTVFRKWRFARAWLLVRLGETP